MSLDVLWLNAYGGTSIIVVLLVCLIYMIRKIGSTTFKLFSMFFLLNFTVYQFSVLLEINSFYHQISVNWLLYFARFVSIILTGPILYLGAIEALSSFSLLKTSQEKKVLIYSSVFILLFFFFEYRAEVPFSFLTDKYAITYSTTIKRVMLLCYAILSAFYTYCIIIKPSQNNHDSSINMELVSIFMARYRGMIITFIPSLLLSIIPVISSYWITLQLLLYSTMIYMQFLSNATKYSKLESNEVTPTTDSKQKKEKMLIENGEEVLEKLMKAIEEDKLYLDSNLSLSGLSSHIKHPSHIVSIVINKTCKMSFIQLINSYRVEEAKELLLKNNSCYSISSIAIDVGFNSVSTFNRAFKKMEGITPSQFQKQMLSLCNVN